MRRALTKHDEADALGTQLQENQYEKICGLKEEYGVFSNLIPENIEAVTLVANVSRKGRFKSRLRRTTTR